jgi:mono/diheme cytochrome c family protein
MGNQLIRNMFMFILLFSAAFFTVVNEAHSDGTSPLLPAFADRSRVPASGKQGPPGAAAALNGNWKKGESLFARHCQPCHGPRGTDKVANPGSDDGTVPALNPVEPDMADKKPAAFAAKIDRYIQHGSVPDGPDPVLFMPDWGDSKSLSQNDIASIEAYVLRLNGEKGRTDRE